MNMFNWYMKIMTWLSPSVEPYQIRGGGFNYGGFNNNQPVSAAQIAAELAKINPTLIKGAPLSTAYTPNPYTQNQLAQFNQPQGVQGNPFYQQYLNKMNGMGAGTGKNMPSIAPQPVAASPVAASIAPQPVAASPVAAAGGKNGPII